MRKFYNLISLTDMYICDGKIVKHRYRGGENCNIEFRTAVVQDKVSIERTTVDRITIISNDKRRIAQIKLACQFYKNLGVKIIINENFVSN